MDKNAEMSVRVFYKPRFSTYLLLFFGVFLIVTGKGGLMVLGGIFLLISYVMFFVIKDSLRAKIDASRICLYGVNECNIANLEISDVMEWNTSSKGIYIKTVDEREYFTETYDTMQANRALRKILADKETINLLKNEKRKRKSK